MNRPLIALLLLAGVVAGCSNEPQTGGMPPPQMGPVEVAVIELKSQSVARTIELPGRSLDQRLGRTRSQFRRCDG